MHPQPNNDALKVAAAAAVYRHSDYHCVGPKGQAPRGRARPASICPRNWNEQQATNALRGAIEDGKVSEVWEDGFPRYVWHRDGTTLYEARHTRGPAGTFHAYPIEAVQAPPGLLS
jgi:hypothetical protein